MNETTTPATQPTQHSLKGLNGTPSAWLERFVPLFPEEGEILDLACGCGRNTGYLVSWGFKVTGVDIDERCKPYVEEFPKAKFLQADLESEPWPLKGMTFDVVLVDFFLSRKILPLIPSLLNPGGYLVYETFTMPYKGFDGNRAKNEDFVLSPLELVDTFRKDLAILAYEQTLGEKGDCFERILARKPIDGLNMPVHLFSF